MKFFSFLLNITAENLSINPVQSLWVGFNLGPHGQVLDACMFTWLTIVRTEYKLYK